MKGRVLKVFIITALALIMLVGGVFALALFNANALIAGLKPRLEELISKQLHTAVSIGEIETSIFPNTQLRVRELMLGSGAGAADNLKLRDLFLDINLMALLQKELHIVKLSLDSPSINLRMTTHGVQIVGLPGPRDKDQSGETRSKGHAETTGEDTSARDGASPLKVALKQIEVHNATLNVLDEVSKKSYGVTNLELAASVATENRNLSISKLKLIGKASAPDLGENIPFEIGSPTILLRDKELETAEILLTALGAKMTLGLTYNLESKKGEGTLSLANVSYKAGEFAVTDLNSVLSFRTDPTEHQIGTKNLELKLNGQPIGAAFDTHLRGEVLTVKNLEARLFSGKVQGELDLNLIGDKPFSTHLTANALSIDQALQTLKNGADQKISGVIQSLKVNLNGSLSVSGIAPQYDVTGIAPQYHRDVAHSLQGTINLHLSDGQFKGFNLAGIVLKAVNNLPMLTGALYGSVPPGQKASVDSSDTAFRSLTGTLTLAGGVMQTKDLNLITPTYSLESDGKVSFDGTLDLNATILFNPEFSAHLVSVSKELRNGLDDQGRLVIPLTIQGTPPAIIVIPNVKKLVQVLAKNVLKDKAADVLKNALGGKGSDGTGGLGKLLGF